LQTLTIILVLGFIAYKIGYIVVKAAVKDAMKEEYEKYSKLLMVRMKEDNSDD
jgi:hypothetical protein